MVKSKLNDKIIVWALVILGSLVYISLIFNTNVWMDEAFTASLAHHNFVEVIRLSMADTLPPLYNIILWLTTSVFGYHIAVMKLTSVIPMILVMVLGATTVRKRHGLITAIAFILSITGMPLMLYFGVEIRMYSLGFLFATASGIYAHEVLVDSNTKNWVLFTVFSTLAGYSHHFAFVTVGFIYGGILLHYLLGDRKHIMRWVKCLGFTFAGYFPCLLVTLKQFGNVSGYFSMPDVTLPLFAQYVVYPFMVGIRPVTIVLLALVFVLLLWTVIRFVKGIDRTGSTVFSLCCFTVYYGVLIFGTIISKIMTANIFVDRYLFFSTGLLWLFASIQIGKLNDIGKKIAIAVIILTLISSYVVEYKVEYSKSGDEEIAFLDANVSEGDLLYCCSYYEDLENCLPFYSLINGGATLNAVAPLEVALDKATNDNVTLYVAVSDEYELTNQEEELINAKGYKLVKVEEFDFDRYSCEMFRVER